MMKTTPFLLIAALALTVHSAQALSGAWTGATDDNWNVNNNWTPATGYPAAGNTATFNADVTNSTISLNTAINVLGITFASGTGSYTFNAGGGSLAVTAITIDSAVTSAVTQTFNVRLDYATGGNNYIRNNSATAVVDLHGGIDNASAANNLQFYVDSPGVVILNGASSNNGKAITISSQATVPTGKLIYTGTSSGNVSLSVGYQRIVQFNSVGAMNFSGNGIGMTGGIIGLGAEDFTLPIATSGPNTIRWSTTVTGDTGFAAYGANRNVNMGGAGGAFVWTGFNQIKNTAGLILGSADSTHTLNFQNQLGLSNAARTIVVNDGIYTNNIDGEISGVISSSTAALGSVTKTGAGTLLLSATNTYTGLTTVSVGTLLVGNSSGNGSLAGGASVASGAVLGGSGSIAGAVTIDGSLRPGNSIGTLTVQNDVTWNGGNNWVFELGTAGVNMGSPGTSDLLNLTGIGSDFLKGSGSTWTFDFAGTGATGWYKLVDWAGSTTFTAGNFTAINLTPGFSGTFTVDAGTSALYLTVVPEPSTWLLLGLGGLFLLTFRRRTCPMAHRLS